jgi:uncharacterized protein (TIGR03546 family)
MIVWAWGILMKNADARSLARGCAWGAALGLLPKFNLLAALMILAILCMRVNMLAVLFAVGFASLVGQQLQPVFHYLGSAVLHFAPLQGLYCRLFALPLVPWTAMDNTVVAGAFCLACAQYYPTRRILESWFRAVLPRWRAEQKIQNAVTLRAS